MNPSAGGGRARGRLPAAERTLRERNADYGLVLSESLAHARELAREAGAEGRIPVVMSGDGMIGAVGGVLAGTGAPLGVIPGGRGNDLARVLGIPTEPGRGRRQPARRRAPAHRRRRGERRPFPLHRLLRLRLRREPDRERGALVRGPLVYAYAALRALAQWRPATFTLRWPEGERSFSGYSVAVANSKAYGGGMFVAPDAELDDGLLDVVTTAEVSRSSASCAGLPDVFKGTHVEREEVDVFRCTELRDHRRPAVRRVRRRRADHAAAGPRAPAARGALEVIAPPEPPRVSGRTRAPRRSPAFAGKRAVARAVGGLSRLSGRGGGTTLPGRVLLRTAPDAIERLGAGLSGGSAIVSATNGKTTTAG